ncbi:MAG: glutamate-5-semialdehyde dehydrogenase [Epsilonproteobacteria bacterium]|nr:glutamate-5-semialdehyde dehydrogenase [Campylobacterota bacterium]NPA63703.1 glutamate-5-semialdehyde dehydrogenase [Campylobacterota bacterium]
MEEFLIRAKKSASELVKIDGAKKKRVLQDMAKALRDHRAAILEANAKDLAYAREANLSAALIDRLLLDESRIEGMARSIEEIAALKDPVGRVLDGWVIDNGLRIEKVSIPIGVIGVIYESRPNVTSDAAALCFKSGNVAILKGGKEARHSNEAIAKLLQESLKAHGLPEEAISLLPDYSREGVDKLIRMDKYVDLIIPRGGEALIRHITRNATVPVVKHDKGLCHTYIDKDADFDEAVRIAVNAKVQRPGVCNAMETLLIDYAIKDEILLKLYEAFKPHLTTLKGCALTKEVLPDIEEADEEDFHTEYLENILSIKVVDGVDGAIEHIRTFGSGHSEAIVTQNYETAERFLNEIDAACVYLNASTRFTDGGVFGFGAEVGISTNKLHARGPMGINDLTTYKYKIYGHGQIRE